MTLVDRLRLRSGKFSRWTYGVGVALALSATGAFGHDVWISRKHLVDPESRQWCCDEHDCEPLRAGEVRELGASYTIAETGESIPSTRVIWRSEDGLWWRCRNLKDNSTRCLIGPPRGS